MNAMKFPSGGQSRGVVRPLRWRKVAESLCDRALAAAKSRCHPLVRNDGLERLGYRSEFVQGFKQALEAGVAQQLAARLPDIQAIFTFENDLPTENKTWKDSRIHILVVTSQPPGPVRTLARALDRLLTAGLSRLNWSRFRASRSVLEVQWVTPKEIRLGLSYGAMFFSVWNVPVQIWPQKKQVKVDRRSSL